MRYRTDGPVPQPQHCSTPKVSNIVNAKNVWIIGIVTITILLSSLVYSGPDIGVMRSSYAISPDAVIVFSKSGCGHVCIHQAELIRSSGVEVITLDIDDGTAGSHLWQALEGGDSPLPAVLMGGSNHLHGAGHALDVELSER